MDLKKIAFFTLAAILLAAGLGGRVLAQDRARVVKTISSRPINQPPASSPTIEPQKATPAPAAQNLVSRPVLTNKIEVAPAADAQPLVKKTGSTSPVEMTRALAAKNLYNDSASGQLMSGIRTRYGIPYRYGSEGPNRYDCSGFVWSVFHDAGMDFERTSARSLWSQSEPVSGDERYKFGTLVFFNGLGHMGIVADSEGFYHASSSKGITYSKFAGYWEKRIVGFRRFTPKQQIKPNSPPQGDIQSGIKQGK